MRSTTTVVIGAGHCGLAVSRHLARRSIDHVVVERGEPAHSWRTQRWDSLRLLTPNWMTRLPDRPWSGEDAHGYLAVADVVALLTEYARPAPVLGGTEVVAVEPDRGGYRIVTDRGVWRARTVVVATGATARPVVPALPVPSDVVTSTAAQYRNPASLPDGGVLVVGASASGLQIADELAGAGRSVTLAVGEHVRMPRTYRGRDILWWMDATGLLDERWDVVDDLVRARHVPSMQLIGAPRTLELATLADAGVRIVGRLAGVRESTALFSGSLRNVCALADLKLDRLLDRLDAWAVPAGIDAGPAERFDPTPVAEPVLSARLGRGAIESIVWATGFRPELPFLAAAGVLDRKARIVHHGGITAAPGLYTLGMPFLRRRRSTLIDGADGDARAITDHLVAHLDTTSRWAS